MTQYLGIRSEGGLIPYDVLDKIATEESGLGQQPKDFGLTAGRRVTDEIARAWSDAQDYWHIFQRRTASLPESETGTTLTRKWISDLLNEQLLGYELSYQPSGAVIGGKNYPISHRAGSGEEAPPVQIEGFRTDLDRRPEGRRLSPQALVQEYLNNSDGHLWGVVTNGMLLRLLRDTSRTSRPSYLEFDLQSILDGNRFNEFALFYRVCHRTRLPRTAEDSTSCWLEKYFQLSIEQGGRVRDKLRDGVEDALKSLGTGLLRHLKNEPLRERIKSGALTAPEFHRQLLRLVYRLLFLMVAEERRMIVPEAPDSERRQRLYDAYYSVGRLRTLAEKAIERSTFGDLWLSLQRTFGLFENGDSNPLGIPPLNGDLFSALAVRDLQDTHLYNDNLLAAMRRLSLFEDKRVLQRVNYGALDVEELGSVYESLLDFQPVFIDEPEGNKFDLRIGSERKSTGSYYTRPELVRELIESALVPVMQDRLASAKDSDAAKEKEKKEQTILTMSVCDPACGSGHFLLAAARKLGRELAKVRTGEEEPTPREFHLAVRDVVSHCVYGVDVNPLAVDLCKLALWLEGHWTGKPLSFLDHRIKCGNSLIGVLDSSVLGDAIPDDAFTAITGDDKKVASAFKKKNKDERKGQTSLSFDAAEHVHHFAAESDQLLGIAEDTPSDVRRKEEIYRKAREQREWLHDWTAANLWTAAFFVPLTKYDDPVVPTYEPLMDYVVHGKDRPQMTGYANALSVERHFFHWRLEFPDVFDKGGFDVVLGNPPWEKIKLQEQEFFASRRPEIAEARHAAARARMIASLKAAPAGSADRALFNHFETAKRIAESSSLFSRYSGRFKLTGRGDVNTYALFAELCTDLCPHGRAGVILPTGIATDSTTAPFFASLVQQQRLARLVDFENREALFPAVHRMYKFCLLTTASDVRAATFAFFLTNVAQTTERERFFKLSVSEIERINPNTKTAPVFRSRADAALVAKIYSRIPVLINESDASNGNPWRATMTARIWHMAEDAEWLRTGKELQDDGFSRLGNAWIRKNGGSTKYLPLYEAKMAHQFDHRWDTFDELGLESRDVEEQEKRSDDFEPLPRYWVPEKEVHNRLLAQNWKRQWLLGWRRIAPSTNERTLLAAILPRTGAGDSLFFIYPAEEPLRIAALLANFNALVCDYVVRTKVGGMNLSFFLVSQFAILHPTTYSNADLQFIAPRVCELTFTSKSVSAFAPDLREPSEPYQWNSERRHCIRSELDAYYAHLYGFTRDELRYILDPKEVFGDDFPSETFRVLKAREEKEYGEYRTGRLVLEAFDRFAESPRFRDEMPKRKSAFDAPVKNASAEALRI